MTCPFCDEEPAGAAQLRLHLEDAHPFEMKLRRAIVKVGNDRAAEPFNPLEDELALAIELHGIETVRAVAQADNGWLAVHLGKMCQGLDEDWYGPHFAARLLAHVRERFAE